MKFFCSVSFFISLQVCLVQCDTRIFLETLEALRREKKITDDHLYYDDSVFKESLQGTSTDESTLLQLIRRPSLGWNDLVSLFAEKKYAVLRGNSRRKMNADGSEVKAVFEALNPKMINQKSRKLLYDPAYDKVAIQFFYKAVGHTPFVIIFHARTIENYVVQHIRFLRTEFMDHSVKDVLEPVSHGLLNKIALITTEEDPKAFRSDLIVKKIRIEYFAKHLPAFGIMRTLDDKMDDNFDAPKKPDSPKDPDSPKESDSAKDSNSAKETLLLSTARRMGVYVHVVKPIKPAATGTDNPKPEELKRINVGEVKTEESEGDDRGPDDTEGCESEPVDSEGGENEPDETEEDEIEQVEPDTDEIEQEEPETDESEVDTETDETITAYLIIVIEPNPDMFQIANQLWNDVHQVDTAGTMVSKTLLNSIETNQQLNKKAELIASTDGKASTPTPLEAADFGLDTKKFHGIVRNKIKFTVDHYRMDLYNVLTSWVKPMYVDQHTILHDKTNIRVGIGFAMSSVDHGGIYSYYWNIVVLFERAEPNPLK